MFDLTWMAWTWQTATFFAVILALLAVQMADGNDPAVGDRGAATTRSAAAAPQTAQPVEPSYTEPGYDDGYSGDGSDGEYVVPQQDTQQQQNVQPQQQSQGAPLQSGTS